MIPDRALRPPGGRLEAARRPVICIPANALVVLVGASGSGKSSWAQQHFTETQVVSSDRCRALVADDESDQSVNPQAFGVFHEIIRRRLELGRLTIADSTALAPFARAGLRRLARCAGAPVHTVVFCVPLAVLERHNRGRPRRVPLQVLERHAGQLDELVASGELQQEGYDGVHYLRYAARSRVRVVAPASYPPPLPPPGTLHQPQAIL